MKQPPVPPTQSLHKAIRLASCFGLSLVALGAPLQASQWTGSGGSPLWSDGLNWDIDPTGSNVIFASAGAVSGPVNPTNIVGSSISINALSYQYNSAALSHLTEISSGATLTVGGTASPYVLNVGGNTGTNANTLATIRGEGSLILNQTGGNVMIANHRIGDAPNAPATATLDMSGLASFQAQLGTTGSFNVGTSLPAVGGQPHQISSSTVRLAQSSTITAGILRVGSGIPDEQVSIGYVASQLLLGTENFINVDQLHVGRGFTGKATGVVAFDSSALPHSPTLRLRGADGVQAVSSVKVGVNDGSGTSNQQSGSIDFSGGSVDALITNLDVGFGSSSHASNSAIGSFTMDEGRVEVTNAKIGRSSSNTASAAPASGTLNIYGGEFHVENLILAERAGHVANAAMPVTGSLNVAGTGLVHAENGIVMGQRTSGSSASAITATINLDGGTLISEGDIARGTGADAITATINLRGGTLDLTENDIEVSALNLESGTLRNVGEINNGDDLVKTTSGTLTLEGTLLYTGRTEVAAGKLRVDGTLANSVVNVLSGAQLTGTGGVIDNSVLMESGSAMVFDLRAADDFDSLSILSLTLDGNNDLVIDLSYAFAGNEVFTLIQGGYTGSFSTINGVAFGADSSFELAFGGVDYQLQLIYGADSISIQAIPEPSTFALLGAVGLGGWIIRRRR